MAYVLFIPPPPLSSHRLSTWNEDQIKHNSTSHCAYCCNHFFSRWYCTIAVYSSRRLILRQSPVIKDSNSSTFTAEKDTQFSTIQHYDTNRKESVPIRYKIVTLRMRNETNLYQIGADSLRHICSWKDISSIYNLWYSKKYHNSGNN